MKKTSPVWSNWLKYLVRRDKVSKIAVTVSIILFVVWGLLLKDQISVLIPVGVLVATALFSFVSYAGLGVPRIKAEEKFYDAIYGDCGLPSKYAGREMHRVKVDWKFLSAQSVTVQAELGSYLVTSASRWRSIKGSASDAFSRGRLNYTTVFTDHRNGVLTFLSPKHPNTDETMTAIEDLTSFVYSTIDKYNETLPKIENLVMGIGDDKNLPSSFNLNLTFQTDSSDRRKFERDFKQKYDNPEVIWSFNWSGAGLDLSHVRKGTAEERKVYSLKSLSDLIKSSYSSTFLYTDRRELDLDASQVTWDNEDKPESIALDFMHVDISDQDRVERFENKMKQGLYQLFKAPNWAFDWQVSAYEKLLTIRLDSALASAYVPPMAELEEDHAAQETAPAVPFQTSRPAVRSQVPSTISDTPVRGLPARPVRAKPVRPGQNLSE